MAVAVVVDGEGVGGKGWGWRGEGEVGWRGGGEMERGRDSTVCGFGTTLMSASAACSPPSPA